MTATRERQSAPTPDSGGPSWAERSAFPSVRGQAWWSAVSIAVLPTALGILLDMLIGSKPGLLFTGLYVVGCVLGVILVRRRSLFGPMVQPPLVLAVTMPIVVLATNTATSTGGGLSAKVLTVVSPLINGFPAMACTTALVLGIGLVRMFGTQRATPRVDDESADIDGPTKKASRKKPAEPKKKRPTEAAPEGAPREPRGGPPGRGGDPRRREPGPGAGPERGRGRQGAEPGAAPGRAARGQAPGRGRGADGRPDQRSAPPPGRGTGPRPAPGRGKPPERPPGEEPPRRPRRPRRGDSF